MQLDDQLMKSRILNPQTGTALVKYAEPGEVTAAGKPLYKIADTDLLYLPCLCDGGSVIPPETRGTLKVFADRREHLLGIPRYDWISDKSEFTERYPDEGRTGLPVYAIKIAVRNDGYLKIGQYGEIEYEYEDSYKSYHQALWRCRGPAGSVAGDRSVNCSG